MVEGIRRGEACLSEPEGSLIACHNDGQPAAQRYERRKVWTLSEKVVWEGVVETGLLACFVL